MRLKSYHSATVEAAIRLAHIELGDEAVFLGARRNDVGGDPNQAYEVTFAVMEAGDAAPDAAPEPDQRSASDERGEAARPANGPSRPAPRRADPVAAGQPAAAQPAAGQPSGRPGGGRNGVVRWQNLLRRVSRLDPAPAAQNGQRQTPLRPPVSASAPFRSGVSDAAAPAAVNATPEHNGPGGGGGFQLPHWKEFVPGEERRAATARELALRDASRVIEAGGSAAMARPQHAVATRNGEAPARNGEAPARNGEAPARNGEAPTPNGEAPTPNGEAHGAAVAAPQAANNRTRATPPPAARAEVYSLQKLGAELEQLRRMFERRQAGSVPLAPPSRAMLSDARLAGIYQRLSGNAIEPSLAAELVAGLERASAEGAEGRLLGALLAEAVRSRFATNSELGRRGAPRSVAALVGPSGAGKTTAVAKLAFRCGLLRRRSVRLLSVDPLRVGAVESLQAYAELMNVPLEVVEDCGKLGAALGAAGEGEPELLLIDTPGYGRREWERARRLAETFLGRGDIDVHLVLDLRTNSGDLRRAVENFRIFRPAKLLFTRLDETATFGSMLNETVRTGLPVSFVSVGQRVPEDIVPAGEPELLRLLLKDRSSN